MLKLATSTDDVLQFVEMLKSFLGKNAKDLLEKIEAGDNSALNAAQIIGSLQTQLEALGLNNELEKLKGIYGQDLKQIINYLETASGEPREQIISDINRPMVEALIQGGYDQAAGMVETYLGDIRSQVGLSVLAGQKPDLSSIVDDDGESLAGRLNTELSTSIAAFHRTVTVSSAKDLGFELFEYIGPDDKITRPFCEGLLSRNPPIYSISEINKMSNGQGLPVAQFGGGYNCRHIWAPISQEDAEAAGYKSSM